MSKIPEMILLCGFSGSGKSETGAELAKKLDYGFTDTDLTVEEILGKKIPEILLKMGEAKFRFAESDVLRMATKRKPHVVALGGGTIADENNLNFVKESGFLIYLRVKPETIFERLQNSHLRPLLQSMTGEQDHREAIMKRIHKLLDQRQPHYEKADLVIDTDGKSVAEVTEEIVLKLSGDE
jgi:shikimate kinase